MGEKSADKENIKFQCAKNNSVGIWTKDHCVTLYITWYINTSIIVDVYNAIFSCTLNFSDMSVGKIQLSNIVRINAKPNFWTQDLLNNSKIIWDLNTGLNDDVKRSVLSYYPFNEVKGLKKNLQ